jgi:RNA polymerase sigma-70 factor, ECF subfamily
LWLDATLTQGFSTLASDKELSDFLKSIEKRAFKRTAFAVRDEDAALDIVQDAMIRLAQSYADKPPAELAPLFQRILSNITMDWFRSQRSRKGVFANFSDLEPGANDSGFDILEKLELAHGMAAESSSDVFSRQQMLHFIETEIAQLPGRQREAFLLRYWEELDTSETAFSMGCSEGSVKQHCSRAVHALAKALKAKGIEP